MLELRPELHGFTLLFTAATQHKPPAYTPVCLCGWVGNTSPQLAQAQSIWNMHMDGVRHG